MSEIDFNQEAALKNLRERFPDREERISWLRGYRRYLKRRQAKDFVNHYPVTLEALDGLLSVLNSKEA